MSRRTSKRKGKKRRDKKLRASKKNLKQKVRENFPNSKMLANNSPDGVKISEVLGQFVEPYTNYTQTEQAYRRLLSMAVLAWNVTLLPEKDRQSHIDSVLEVLPDEARDDGKSIIEELMERKQRLFADYKRMILDFDVVDTGKSWHLSVVSQAEPV